MSHIPRSIPASRTGPGLLVHLNRHAGRPAAQALEPAVVARRLMGLGWTSAQACDLVAHLHGIPRTDRGWTLHEVDHLLFLRSLVRAGQLVS